MPSDGTMNWEIVNTQLGGEPDGSQAIKITYHFPAGLAGGQSYDSIDRTAYLPASSEGEIALLMMKLAFERRHNFTTGQSITNKCFAVIWKLPHKTSTSGGAFGYPDPEYITKLRNELDKVGITEASVTPLQYIPLGTTLSIQGSAPQSN